MESLNLENLEESIKSSDDTGSADGTPPEDEITNKKHIIEMSNSSMMDGYSMAIQMLEDSGYKEAAEMLKINYDIIKIWLDNGLGERLK